MLEDWSLVCLSEAFRDLEVYWSPVPGMKLDKRVYVGAAKTVGAGYFREPDSFEITVDFLRDFKFTPHNFGTQVVALWQAGLGVEFGDAIQVFDRGSPERDHLVRALKFAPRYRRVPPDAFRQDAPIDPRHAVTFGALMAEETPPACVLLEVRDRHSTALQIPCVMRGNVIFFGHEDIPSKCKPNAPWVPTRLLRSILGRLTKLKSGPFGSGFSEKIGHARCLSPLSHEVAERFGVPALSEVYVVDDIGFTMYRGSVQSVLLPVAADLVRGARQIEGAP